VPIPTAAVGATARLDVRCDTRWVMSYAAGLGCTAPAYLDTVAGVVAHPVFPVGPEWALLTGTPDPFGFGLTRAENASGVHAAHDLVLHRPARPGDDLSLVAQVVAVRRIPAGSLSTVRFDATLADGTPMWTTWMDSVHRGIEVIGDDRSIDDALVGRGSTPELGEPVALVAMPVAANAAHVYTECARIWNPIHTDAAVAAAAGLPGIILHGTATLALGVTAVMEHVGAGPADVARVAGSFRAMVPMPCELEVAIGASTTTEAGLATPFEVRIDGRSAVRVGLVVTRG
jgi:acyl dehydratase